MSALPPIATGKRTSIYVGEVPGADIIQSPPRHARAARHRGRGKVDACYKSLILPNFDAKWTGQEFAGLFDRSFITVSMNCVTAIDVSRVLHEHAIS
jgi:hypothetical protein